MDFKEETHSSTDGTMKRKILRRERTAIRRKPIVSVEEVYDEPRNTPVSKNEETSRNDEDFLNKSLDVFDEINGVFKATIAYINEHNNGNISCTFYLKIYDTQYSIRAYFKPILLRRSGLYRLADALNLLKENDINLSMFLDKELWVSVKTNMVNNTIYENIIDFANIEHHEDELLVNDKGYFIFDY